MKKTKLLQGIKKMLSISTATILVIYLVMYKKISWEGMIALASIATIILNWWLGNKQIKANIVSKSRMEWITRNKQISADYIRDSNLIMASLVNFYSLAIKYESSNYEKHQEIISAQILTTLNSINDMQNEMLKNKSLLSLEFSATNEHKEILGLINEISEVARKEVKLSSEAQNKLLLELEEKNKELIQVNDKISEDVGSLTQHLGDYYKREWEKVKRGK